MRSQTLVRALYVLCLGFPARPGLADSRATQPLRGVRVAHVLVALADNRYQGIVPVPAVIGNGDDPERNLYWGAGYGVRTFLTQSANWEVLGACHPAKYPVLERCLFRHRRERVYVVVDAYRGREIRRAVSDYFLYASGRAPESVAFGNGSVNAAGGADLIAYVGHDGLMDFGLGRYSYWVDNKRRSAVMLACMSRNYFADALRWTGAKPLVWTTGLMAPEGYVLEAILNGWAQNESDEQIRRRAAEAYDQYQHCGANAALRLFVSGW